MAPKKMKAQKMDLGTFLTDGSGKLGSWADEMEDMPVYSRTGYGGNSERRTFNPTTNTYGGSGTGGYSVREELPLPTKPPYTVHLGNLSFDATVADVTDFFAGCECIEVRIIEDREERKPKGFGYATFGTLEGLKQALTLNQASFQGRNVRISVADPPKQNDRPDARELTDWSRKGPLPDLPGRGGNDRRNLSDRFGSGGRGFNDAGSEMGERRREFQPDDGKVRDFSNWERKGPLSPIDRPPQSRDGGRPRTNDGPRTDNFRDRRDSPAAWGEGRGQGSQEGSRPPRREFHDRPAVERAPTAAEQDSQWRSKMRPDAPPAQSTAPPSRDGSEVPASPANPPVALGSGSRPKLNLAKRTVSEVVPDQPSPSMAGDAKASPFGAARPIDTAAKEKEIEEKRLAAIREKKEAEEAEKEGKRLAKEAARLEKETQDATAAQTNGAAAPDTEKVEILQREGVASNATATEPKAANGAVENDSNAKPKEVAPDAAKSNAAIAGAWRRPSGGPPSGPANDSPRDYRGGRGGRGGGPYRGSRNNDRNNDRHEYRNERGNDHRQDSRQDSRQDTRGPRQNGSAAPAIPASPATGAEPATPDEDGWTAVKGPKKSRGGNQAARGT